MKHPESRFLASVATSRFQATECGVIPLGPSENHTLSSKPRGRMAETARLHWRVPEGTHSVWSFAIRKRKRSIPRKFVQLSITLQGHFSVMYRALTAMARALASSQETITSLPPEETRAPARPVSPAEN